MKPADYARFDALGLAKLIRQREVTPEEVVSAAFAAIEALNPKLNAVIALYRAEAEQVLASGLPDGPLRGVPFLVKDLALSFAGKPTTMGSRLFQRFAAPVDSELMVRYRRAGLVTLGRTSTPELGLSFSTEPACYGPTRNPWDPERSAGGSSGGSAAAVAARLVPAAHGNDAAGSLRVPASCCGLFALKPSRGRMPVGPLAGELLFGLAVEHVLTRSVRDSAALLDATAGEDPGAPYAAPARSGTFLEQVSRPPGRLRIAVAEESWSQVPVRPECREAVQRAARLCTDLGHAVVPASPRFEREEIRFACQTLLAVFVSHLVHVLGPRFGLRPEPEALEPSTLAVAEFGRSLKATEFATALAVRDQLARIAGGFFAQVDVLLTPTLAAPPAPLGSLDLNRPGLTGEDVIDRCLAVAPFTAPFNLTGGPAMSVPLHWTGDGRPVGVQFGAALGQEATLLRLAGQVEQAAPWAQRRPPLSVGS